LVVVFVVAQNPCPQNLYTTAKPFAGPQKTFAGLHHICGKGFGQHVWTLLYEIS
jgi:hypothetical protein